VTTIATNGSVHAARRRVLRDVNARRTDAGIQPTAGSAIEDVATRLLIECDAIAEAMATRLHERIPELAKDRDRALLAETRASCGANVGQLLRAFARGERLDHLVTPTEAIEYARGYVRRELPLAVLLRVHRLGQTFFWEQWSAALSEAVADAPTLSEALSGSSVSVFDYVDRICGDLVAAYDEAQGEWAPTPAARRAETVRALLSEELDDEREAGRLLSYELHRRHHTALVIRQSLRGNGWGRRALDRVAAECVRALGAHDSLVVAAGAAELWLWCSHVEAPGKPPTVLAELPLSPGIHVAVGRSARELDGFRQSHLEASAAARVAELAGERAKPVTSYDDVEVIALLSRDIERARAFVRNELGALADPKPSIARLRETILVLVQEGMSNSRAAKRLYVHNNTIVYRARRAQELLGHDLAERRVQVTTALMLTETLGDAVLPLKSD